MYLPQAERTAIFIDGANLYAATRTLSVDIDYRKFLDFFRSSTRLLRATYYTAIIEDQEYSSIRPLIDWLDYNGYSIVTKPIREYSDQQGRRKTKGSIDVELTVDALTIAQSLDHIIIVSGDGSFRYLVEALQLQGKRVTVMSTIKSQPPMIADDLRRQADQFVDIADIVNDIGRPASERRGRDQLPDRYVARDLEDEDEVYED
ncbi:MAG: NYN domain-containing protein [Pseudomonadota bacterium]